MHASDEDLILHYYGEADADGPVARHVSACPHCQGELARLGRVLTLVNEHAVPEPGPAFEREVWARLSPHLHARRHWTDRLWPAVPRWGLAAGVAALVLAAFFVGRVSTPAPEVAPIVADGDVGERVFLVAVGDHLDRSHMVLVELLNAEPGDVAAIGLEQQRARELIAFNRLYQSSAAHTGHEIIGTTLDDLGRVLLEIANAPEDATPADLDAIRQQIGASGLLFRVRVVQSEMRERERERASSIVG